MTQPLLARRTVLKGLGVSLALPFLEAMWPARGFAAQDDLVPRRLAFVFFGNGAVMRKWTPRIEGAGFELTPTLQPLAKVRQKINILTGLMHDNANEKGDGGGDHARSASAFLTGIHARKNGGISLGVSVDQIVARQIGHLTKLPSLEFGAEPNMHAGDCDWGYSCAYSSHISWRTASTPMAKEINPKHAFTRMFGGNHAGQQEAAKRDFYRKSILDGAMDEASRLEKKLGQQDRDKVDEYLTSVREIELRISKAQAPTNKAPPPDFGVPQGIPQDYDEHIRLMYDLLAVAFQTDTTRVATYMVGNEGSHRKYEKLGIDESHHTLSHHQKKEDRLIRVEKIDRYLVSRFAAFLEKLDRTPDGNGTLLDHSLIVYGCAMGDGDSHDHNSLPVVLAGRGGGTLTTGRHIVYPARTPMNNLYLSLLHRMGMQEQRFGDSSERLGKLQG